MSGGEWWRAAKVGERERERERERGGDLERETEREKRWMRESEERFSSN